LALAELDATAESGGEMLVPTVALKHMPATATAAFYDTILIAEVRALALSGIMESNAIDIEGGHRFKATEGTASDLNGPAEILKPALRHLPTPFQRLNGCCGSDVRLFRTICQAPLFDFFEQGKLAAAKRVRIRR
jgi:hypothetical protein